MKVLIIEDDNIWSLKLQIIAEKVGLDILKIVDNLTDAKLFLAHTAPDLIIADIMLGEETVFEVFNTATTKLIPTIFVTALPNNENYKNAEIVERFLFLQKPFTINTFKSAVNLLRFKPANATIEKTGNDKRLVQQQFNEVFKIIDDTNLLQKFNLYKLETEIIMQRLQNNKTFGEIGIEVGLSDERVRRLFYKALRKLKAKIKNTEERYTRFLEFTKLKKNNLELNATLTSKNLNANKVQGLKEDYLNQSIDDLELLGTKWKNVLHEKHINTIEDLIKLNKRQLLLLPKFGVFAVSQIELELSKNGFQLQK